MAITNISDLRGHLQWSIEIEHCTIPPYLTALYSIKEGHNPEAAEVIHSVAMEEMLHLTLAANLLNAIGGAPRLDTPALLPGYPMHLPHSNRAFLVGITKFSREAIETFMKIERPKEHLGLPEDDDYETIGQFYEAIEEALIRLCNELGEQAVFIGDSSRQITDDHDYGGSGRIIAVRDLESALAALGEIVEQGEGLQHDEVWDGDRSMFHPRQAEVAHYFRFGEILAGRRYKAGDTPQSGPTGEEFTVDWDAVHDIRPNPRSDAYPDGSEVRRRLEAFHRAYSGLLHLLHESYNGSPRLLGVATGAMYGLKDQMIELMQLPSGDGETTVGPSFEYVPPEDRHRAARQARRIVVVAEGPYVVYGDVPLVRKKKIVSDDDDSVNWMKVEAIPTEETYALCRCGRSGSKPFCDGTHARKVWDGSETAAVEPSAQRQYELDGTGFVVRRDDYLCMHAAFCVGRLRRIPELMPHTEDSDVRAQVMGMIERCPSGSYTYALDTGEEVEPDLPVAVAITQEEGSLAGPLWITGGIPIARADGRPFEVRNRTTLCRCGKSKKKPLCDGTHRKIGFRE